MTIIGRGYSLLAKGQDRIEHSLTVSQLRMDSAMHSFVSGASDPNMLASMMMGGLTGRVLKLGVLSSASSLSSRFLIPASYGLGLLGEAAAFETTHRVLQLARGQISPNALRWGGEQGLGHGIFHSLVSFASLNAVGHLARGSNFVLQHAAQSSAFVFSHHLAASLDLQARDERDWVTQFVEAEVMNLQMGLGKSLLNTTLPGFALFERSADLQNEMFSVSARGRALGSLQTDSFLLPRMASQNFSELKIVEGVNSGNYDRLLTFLQEARGKTLVFAPETYSFTERYAPAIRLWFALQAHAHEYAGLRFELEGVTLRYGEFPGEKQEIRLEAANATISTPRMGTLIEVNTSRGDFEEIHEVLGTIYREYASRTVRGLSDRSTTIRTFFRESIASEIRSGIYSHYSEMRRWLHAVSPEIFEMSACLSRGETLSEVQKSRLAEIQVIERRWMDEFLGYKHLWHWMEVNKALSAREEVLEGPSVPQVLHDLNNRLSALMTLSADISMLEAGLPLGKSLVHATQTSTHLTVASAVNEGIGMAVAMANQMGIKVSTLSGIPQRFQHVLLKEDTHVEFALMDVMGNLLSNAFRYSDPTKGVEALKPRMTAHFLREGDLEITVFDQGIGILPESFDRLGESGFREARKEVEGSSGHGISSVIQILRERGWGPLWVRSVPHAGSAFRFVIPKSDFERAEEFVADPMEDMDTLRPADPLSYVERNLQEGFRVPPTSLDMAISQLLAEIPPDRSILQLSRAEIRAMFLGELEHRRLIALHRLLSGAWGPAQVTAVDNAYGPNPNVFLSLARLGTRVWLKEPDTEFNATQIIDLDTLFPELRDLLLMTDASTLNAELPVPARVVYWSNPSYANFALPGGRTLPEYLSRDVGVGGYLVIQNGRGVFEKQTRSLNFDTSQWQLVYQSEPMKDPRRVADERVLPTSSSSPNVIFIYRRIR